METTSSIKKFAAGRLIESSIAIPVLTLACIFFLYVPSTRWFGALFILLVVVRIKSIPFYTKIHRDPESYTGASKLEIKDGCLLIQNPHPICMKKIDLQHIKSVSLHGRTLRVRFKQPKFDILTTFLTADKTKIQEAAGKLRENSTFGVKIK